MTAILQQLVGEARAAADPGAPWIMEGGRSCPIGHDTCSQPVFRLAGTGHYDYGDRGGPGAESCRTECPRHLEPSEHLFENEQQQYADVREERGEAERYLAMLGAAKPHWAKHCQEGGELCRAGQRDGVVCADDECDIDTGAREKDPAQ